jgi:hypothetical protein
MLIEAPYNFEVAYIGGTYDGQITMFQLGSGNTYIGTWSTLIAYVGGNAVTGSDGNVYLAVASSTGVNPVGDDGSNWVQAPPYYLAGYQVSLVIEGAFTLTSNSGQGLTVGASTGVITIHAWPSQTGQVQVSNPHYYVQLTASSGDIYFPLAGNIQFTEP